MSASLTLGIKTNGVKLDQSCTISPRTEAMANYFQKVTKKTAGTSPLICQEPTLT